MSNGWLDKLTASEVVGAAANWMDEYGDGETPYERIVEGCWAALGDWVREQEDRG